MKKVLENITIASIEDIPQLVALINGAYRGEGSKKGWTTEADLLDGIRTDADSLRTMIKNHNAAILKFCNEDNDLTGCVYLEKKDKKMYVGMVTVSPLQQAKGIGKKLLTAAEDYGGKQQCSAMQMTVISVREELINWYERHGYYITGETLPFPTDERFGIQKKPLQFIVMEKEI